MDTQNVTASTQTASEMLGELRTLRTRAEAHLGAVRRTALAERDLGLIYNEKQTDFERRRDAVIADARHAEAVARDFGIDIKRGMAPIQRRLEGRQGYGLSSGEWEKAGAMGGTAQSLFAGAPLSAAVAELRSAIATGDRPRVASFSIAAEARLRERPARANDGKVPITEQQDARELHALIAKARGLCEDRSLDGVRDAFRELVGVAGDLGATVHRIRSQREQQAQIDAGEKVPWPPSRVDRDGVQRHLHPDGVYRA